MNDPADDSLDCPILHVDMDAFFAAVSLRDRPDLAEVPVLISAGGRGVVLAANYPARRRGIRAGWPVSRALRACPEAVTMPPDGSLSEVSASVMDLFGEITPKVEAASIDEAFLDVSGSARRLGSPRDIAERIRAQVADEQRITCSVGVAASVAVAKIASRLAKPDGVVVVPPAKVPDLLHPLDLTEMWGIGASTRTRLRGFGLVTIGDLAHTPLPALQQMIGAAAGASLHRRAWGADRSVVVPRFSMSEAGRSMGAEETFGRDVRDREVLLRELLRLSARVCRRLRAARATARCVAIKVRYANFETLHRSRTLTEPTDVTSLLHSEAVRLFDAVWNRRRPLRLVGVRAEQLVSRSRVHPQLLLGAREHGWAEADRAADAAGLRFGRDAVRPASLLFDRP